MFNTPALLENNTGELGRQFPTMFVRMGLWELLSQEARERVCAQPDEESFEQRFLYECLIVGLIATVDIEDGED